jgi:hypothetical protein
MSNSQEKFVEQINEALNDIDRIEDFHVNDTNDPEIVEIVIRGRLRGRLKGSSRKSDPETDYDRAMRGIT